MRRASHVGAPRPRIDTGEHRNGRDRSGRGDLNGRALHEAGQGVHETRDELAVAPILHEVRHALRGAGDLDDDSLLVRDEADDDALTVGGEGEGRLERDEAGVDVRAGQGRLVDGLQRARRRVEDLLVRQAVLERLRGASSKTHGVSL